MHASPAWPLTAGVSADAALAQLETAVANSVSIVVASVMEDKLPSYQAAQQETEDKSAGKLLLSSITLSQSCVRYLACWMQLGGKRLTEPRGTEARDVVVLHPSQFYAV